MSFGGGFGGRDRFRLVPRTEREQLLFIAAAGLVFSLIVIFVVVLNYRSDASARDAGSTPTALNATFANVTLLVPERAVHSGERLAEVPFKEAPWPAGQVPEGAIRDRSELASLYARADLSPGVPLQRDFVSNQPIIAPLPIAPGFRAVTIEVDQTTGLEGLALPGTRVDVLHTAQHDPHNKEFSTKAIVQNARILSAGGNTATIEERNSSSKGFSLGNNNNNTRKPTEASTVTLEVTPEDAMTIANSRHVGKLSLMMRAPEDTKILPDIAIGQGSHVKVRDTVVGGGDCQPRGRARIDGREYLIDCNGNKIELKSFGEP